MKTNLNDNILRKYFVDISDYLIILNFAYICLGFSTDRLRITEVQK